MRFEEVSKLAHPASLVLETMIERMEEIVPFLPNIESIEVQERKKSKNGNLRILRRWQGTADGIPSAIRPFISRDLMAWIDTAEWTPQEFKVEWAHSTVSASVAKLYDCSGVNTFKPHPDDPKGCTEIRISGELKLYPDRLPGVPSFLANRMAPQVEKFIVNLITPNLTDLAKGLQGYLDQTAKPARKKR